MRILAAAPILAVQETFRIWVGIFACFSLMTASPAATHATTLNLSRDLASLNIGANNLLPNQPSLDAGPLLVKGIEYAKANGISLVTVDPGAYYFLSLQYPDRHVDLSSVNNMTLDFAGADFYFRYAQHIGIALSNSMNTVLKNFTLDFSPLPFTQVTVTAVDTDARRISFTVPSNWQSPTAFNTPQNPYGLPEDVWVFFFRNGGIVHDLTRLRVQRPIESGSFTIGHVFDGAPWETSDVLARIRPGDIAVLADRGAGEPLLVSRTDGVTLQNIRIYSGGVNGINVAESSRSLLERIYVMPRPGTDRLISTNADGITLAQLGDNNTVRLSRAIRTLDDGFSPHSLVYGTVVRMVNNRTLTIQRQYTIGFPNGVPVVFENPTDGTIAGSATVVAQRPLEVYPTPGQIDVDVDRDLPASIVGTVLYSTDPAQRGGNTLLERNLVEDQVFARGMSLWGLVNSTVRGNYIHGSQMSAIFGTHRLMTYDWMSPPLQNLVISNNVIDGAITSFGGPVVEKEGAIQLLAQRSPDAQAMSVSPHENISITDNFIGNSARSGIRVENVAGATVEGNVIVNSGLDPYKDGYWEDTFEPFRTEFRQPLIVKSSESVSTIDNQTEGAVTRIKITDPGMNRLSAYAPGSSLLLHAFGIDILPNPVVTLNDADGKTLPLAALTRTPDALAVQLPETSALGGAYVTLVSGNRVLRGTLFIDSQDNFALPQEAPVSQIDCLFSWAERSYPGLFAPGGTASYTLAPYYYRYYSQSGSYLGVSSTDNHVYYMSGGVMSDAGPASNWYGIAGCQ